MTSIEIDELVVQEVPERSYVVVRERVAPDGLSAIPRLIDQVGEWVTNHGGACGAPAACYGQPEADGAMELAVGWPTVSAEEPQPPLERLGTPEDIAEVVSFLASPAGHWVNGQVVRANGGII